MSGSAKAAEELAALRAKHGCEPRLGCELNAHRDLGFCAFCRGIDLEVLAWRLLAMAERGVAVQAPTHYVDPQAVKVERGIFKPADPIPLPPDSSR